MEDLAELLERRKAQYQGDQGANKSDMVAPSSKLLVSPQSSSTFNKQQQQHGGGSPTSRSQQHQQHQHQQQLQQKQEVVAQHPQPRGGGGGGEESQVDQEEDDDYDDDHQQQQKQQPPKEEKESGGGQEKESSPEFPEEGEHTGISPTSSLRKQGFPGGGGPSLLSPSARTIGTQSPSGASHKKLIDTFLRGVREIGRHRCPSERELEITRDYLNWLAFKTREDHVRSVDEIVTQIPTQFNEEIRKLQQAEDLVYAAAAGRLEKVKKNLEENWELTQAVDVRQDKTRCYYSLFNNHPYHFSLLLLPVFCLLAERWENCVALSSCCGSARSYRDAS